MRFTAISFSPPAFIKRVQIFFPIYKTHVTANYGGKISVDSPTFAYKVILFNHMVLFININIVNMQSLQIQHSNISGTNFEILNFIN